MIYLIVALMVAAGGVGAFFFKRVPSKVGNAFCVVLGLAFLVFAISPETRKQGIVWFLAAFALLAHRLDNQRKVRNAQTLLQ